MNLKEDLTSDGTVSTDPRIAVGNESKINYGDESTLKQLDQIVHYKFNAVWTERFIVNIKRYFLTPVIRACRCPGSRNWNQRAWQK